MPPERNTFPITPYFMCTGLAVAELQLYGAFLHQVAFSITLFFSLGARSFQRGLTRRESERDLSLVKHCLVPLEGLLEGWSSYSYKSSGSRQQPSSGRCQTHNGCSANISDAPYLERQLSKCIMRRSSDSESGPQRIEKLIHLLI